MVEATSDTRRAVTPDRYTAVAILFRWTIAVLVGCNLWRTAI